MTVGAENRKPTTNPTQPTTQVCALRQTGWLRALARCHWEAGSLSCQKRIFKITLSICSAISEFIETKLFNKISLDLNSGERARSTFFSHLELSPPFWNPTFSGSSRFLRQIRGYTRPVGSKHSKEGQREPCSISPDFDWVRRNDFGKLH